VIDSQESRQRIARAFPFVAHLTDAIRSEFFGVAMLQQIAKGQPVCQEGMICSHLALLMAGSARVYKIGENGRDITLYRVTSGQSCILTASCILSDLAFPAFAVCEQSAEAVVLPSHHVRQWANSSPAFRDYLFGLMAHRLGSLIHVVEEVVFQRLDQRLAAYLLERDHAKTHLIRATHQEIASDLGSSREVISRILKDFESRKFIHMSRGEIRLLDQASLRIKAKDSA
jgi:CRP/FNR family transcriptional regulator